MNTGTQGFPWMDGPRNKRDRARFAILNRTGQVAASLRAQELFKDNPRRPPGQRLTIARCWREALDWATEMRNARLQP